MKKRRIDINDEPIVDWISEPVFEFKSEADALVMLQALGDELRTAREQERHCMRYLAAAIQQARSIENRPSKQAIINETGLARQTVFGILGED